MFGNLQWELKVFIVNKLNHKFYIMSKTLQGHETTIWYIAYTLSKDVFHFGCVTENQICTTGQEELESFETEEAMATRLGELTGDANYYQNYLDEQESELVE